MKKKVFKFEEGKRKDVYIREIKQLIRNNPKADTVAGYDEKGNYIVTVMTPDWRDKLKFNKNSQPVVNNMDYNKQKDIKNIIVKDMRKSNESKC